MEWILGVMLFVAYLASGALPETTVFPGIRPLLKVGPVKMDWRDILALLIVGVAIYALYTGEMSPQGVIILLGGILMGKAIAK